MVPPASEATTGCNEEKKSAAIFKEGCNKEFSETFKKFRKSQISDLVFMDLVEVVRIHKWEIYLEFL